MRLVVKSGSRKSNITKGRIILKKVATLEGSTICIRGRWMMSCNEFIIFNKCSMLPVPAINTFIPTDKKNVI